MLLALDTSTRTGSVALAVGGEISVYKTLDTNAHHGAALATVVAALETDLARVEHFALTIGPGSFTGLRIALAFLKGLALVHPRPVLAVSTLEVMAAGLADEEPDTALFLPLLDARRGEVYAGLFEREPSGGIAPVAALGEGSYPLGVLAERVRTHARGSRVLGGGDGARLPCEGAAPWTPVRDELLIPDARVLARIACARLREGALGSPAADLEPAYWMEPPGGAAR